MYWNIYLSNFFKNHFQNPQDFSLLQKEERSVMDRNHVGYDDKKIYALGKKRMFGTKIPYIKTVIMFWHYDHWL